MTYKWLRKLVRKISIISKLTATPKKWLRKFCVCVWGEKSLLEGGAYFLLGLKGPCKTIALYEGEKGAAYFFGPEFQSVK